MVAPVARGTVDLIATPWIMFNRVGNAPRAQPARPDPRPENVGRNKPPQFRHRGSAFARGLPELRKLVPAYGPLAYRIGLQSSRTIVHRPDLPVKWI